MKRFMRECAALAIVLLVLATDAGAHSATRIEVRDGRVFTDCSFTVDKDYKVVVLKCDSLSLTISFSDIVHIYDNDGTDVSRSYLGKYYRPDLPPKPSPAPPGVPDKSRWKAWKGDDRWSKRYRLGLSGFSDYSVPFGRYYHGIDMRPGFGLEVSICTGESHGIRISLSKQGANVDNAEFIDNDRFVSDSVTFVDASVSIYQVDVSFQYYGWPNWKEGGRVWWYLTAGGGLIHYSYSGRVRWFNEFFAIRYDGPFDDYETGLFGSGSAGVVTMLSRTIGVDCAVRSQVVLMGRYGRSVGYDGYLEDIDLLVSARLGLLYLFRD